MSDYTAEIRHSEDTIRAMAAAQYDAFRGAGYYLVFVISLACLGAAVFWQGLGQGVKILLLVVGSFAIVGLNTPPKQLADQVIRSLNGKFPKISYRFTEAEILLKGTDTSEPQAYDRIIRLTETPDYLYLFIENRSAYMIDRKTVKPDCEGLMALLSRRTGLEWTKNATLLNTSLRLIRSQRKNTK